MCNDQLAPVLARQGCYPQEALHENVVQRPSGCEEILAVLVRISCLHGRPSSAHTRMFCACVLTAIGLGL
jgi:hypothetical protein